jgi:hypothetical protein
MARGHGRKSHTLHHRKRVHEARCLFLVGALVAALMTSIVGSAQADQIAQAQLVSPVPAAWTPNILDGQVNAIVQVGDRMIAAGTFTQAQNATGGTTYTRSRIVAFDATTGVIDTGFTADVNAGITSMVVAPEGNVVIIGGVFTSVNGTAVHRMVKLNVATGALVSAFGAKVTGRINDIELWGSSVVLGGQFPKVDGLDRPVLAAVNATTGAIDNRLQDLSIAGMFNDGATNIKRLDDVSSDGSKLIAIGNFPLARPANRLTGPVTSVGAQPRVRIAMFNLSTNPVSLSTWATNGFSGNCAGVFDSYMRDVEFSPDGSYFIVGDTGAGHFPTTYCDTLTRWESGATGTGRDPDLGRLLRWPHDHRRGRHRLGGVRGRSHALDEQRRGRRRRGRRGGVSRRPGCARPAERDAARLETRRAPAVWESSRCWRPPPACGSGMTRRLWRTRHNRIAFFPLAGASAVATGTNATLPATLYSTARTICPAADTSVLYRVNAGGPATAANDCGPDWQGDDGTTQPVPEQQQQGGRTLEHPGRRDLCGAGRHAPHRVRHRAVEPVGPQQCSGRSPSRQIATSRSGSTSRTL